MTTARDKFYYTRTLCCLLKALEGEETEIELRNESHVKGTVESVTAAMNVTMRNCELTVNGRSKQLQRLLVQGRKIRMVIIPDHIDMIDAMQRVIRMYNLTAKGRNEFKKTPTAKQRGRGHSRGGLRGRGRAQGGGRATRGRGDGGGGRGRGRSVPYQKTGGFGNQTLNISGDSFDTGGIATDSSSVGGFGAQWFGKHTQHSVGSSSRTETSMLHPEYVKHTSDDFVSPYHQEAGPSVHVGETSIRRRTDDGTPFWPHEPSDHTSAVQCPAISSTARSSATVSPDLRDRLHHLQHSDTDRKHSSKFSERRHAESSRSPDRLWRHTESDHGWQPSGSDTESGNASGKHRQVKREEKDSYSRHDRKSWSHDRNRHWTSRHISPSAVRQHSPSQTHRHPSSRDSRPSTSQRTDDSDSWTRRLGDSDRHRVEGGDRRGQRQKSAERSTSFPSHSGRSRDSRRDSPSGHSRNSRRDSHSEHSRKRSSQGKSSSGD